MKRWILRGLIGLVVVVVFAAAGVFAASEFVIRHGPAKAPAPLRASVDAGSVARGKRIATLMGCHDCHGADLTGRLFFDQMPIARMAGPNLSRLAPHQTDEDLNRAIRQGVAADGRPLWIMPSDAFARLNDQETADLIAYIRTYPAKGEAQPVKQIGMVGRLGALIGKFNAAPKLIKAEGHLAPPDLGPRYAEGRSLARACVECHGAELKGSAVTGAPDLAIAGAYDLADFEKLLRTGVAAGNRKLGLMSESAPGRFNVLSHEEIAALHGYLRARAEKVS